LALSLVLSLVLTIVLNVVLRVVPRAGDRAASALARAAQPRPGEPERRVQVFVPWKAMLVASVVLTLLVNLLVR
jgi:hypothetical protein